MTWAELERKAIRAGCIRLRDGTKHARIYSPITGKVERMSRQSSHEVPKWLAEKILKNLGVDL